MSYGFEVRSADGKTQLDTSTWLWQFAYSFNFQENYDGYRQGLVRTQSGSNVTYVFDGNIIAGSVVLDGSNGKPAIAYGTEVYVFNTLNQNNQPHMVNQVFHYSNYNGFLKISYSHLDVNAYTGDNQSFDPNRYYYTTINVFTR